jgi:hypothetical protein
MEPVWRAIQQDADAHKAARELNEMTSVEHESLTDELSLRRPLSGAGGGVPFNVGPGVTVFRKPYDYQMSSHQGEQVTVSADPAAGTFLVRIRGDEDGALGGYCAIGLGLETAQAGVVSIRPMVSYWAWGTVRGWLLSATSVGHIGHYVESDKAEVVSNHQDVELWNWTESEPYFPTYTGYVGGWSEEVHFRAQANRRYTVWFWGHVFGDQSGPPKSIFELGHSHTQGYLEADVNWVIVELK